MLLRRIEEECRENNDVVNADEGNFEVVEDGDNFELVEDGDNFEVVEDGVVIEDIVSVEKYDVFVEGTDDIDVMENIHVTSKLSNSRGIKSIILPTKVRTCGRPKGAVLTTIGLPKKRLRSSQKTETKTKKIGNRDIAVNSDEPTYCLCNQNSYGEMICCDNDLYPVEWFHFSCVSLSTKPKGKWFCPKGRGVHPNKMKSKAQLLKELECYNKEKEDKA